MDRAAEGLLWDVAGSTGAIHHAPRSWVGVTFPKDAPVASWVVPDLFARRCSSRLPPTRPMTVVASTGVSWVS